MATNKVLYTEYSLKEISLWVKGIVIILHIGLHNEMEGRGSSTAPCYLSYRKYKPLYFYSNTHVFVVYLCVLICVR